MDYHGLCRLFAVGCRGGWTNVEYIEFSSGDEFRKFMSMDPVSCSDIVSCDIGALSIELQGGSLVEGI